ncbi:hypothetical protein NYR55_11125 [Sphingomonas sp. BGYR3]|uniref:hypothetical protein n=1 Tax=Sphingomonas sp. BGYR3 TaxID=2975483 RepID=UPI0021A865D1|nr:hypothetical protein [Sphingomonas sp. BGYR3]MDG5489166.1 hypothetical protein [Sphingomonas sp. BGYR3]
MAELLGIRQKSQHFSQAIDFRLETLAVVIRETSGLADFRRLHPARKRPLPGAKVVAVGITKQQSEHQDSPVLAQRARRDY